MCGIVGYIGIKPCEEVLLHMLSKLDYRGYDSSGIAVKADNNISLLKDTCSVSELTSFIDTYHYGLGIGHTRWATHGKSTKINAHPHFSTNKEFYVVHNGIIENYKELKQTLINNNKTFISETDTEIIPQLLEHYNAYDIHTFIDSINKLTGSYAIATINSKNNHIFLAKNKSPLYISTTDNEIFISSDPLSFSNYNSNFYILEDNEFCDVFDNMCIFYDNKHNIIDKTMYNVSLDYNSSNKCNYSTFMEKEIYEIPIVLDNIINNYSDNTYLSQLNNYDIKDINNIKIIGCGSAYHSGLIGAKYLESIVGIPTNTNLASEYLYSNPIHTKGTLYIFVSQSGETADTINTIKMLPKSDLPIIAITNVPHSTISQLADIVLPIFAGPEIAVASTKAYVGQLLIFYLLALFLKHKTLSIDIITHLKNLISKINISKLDYSKQLMDTISNPKDVILIGKDTDYYTTLEGALKIREITYDNILSVPSGELKHGSLALVSDTTTAIVVITKEQLVQKNINAVNEITARGGKCIIITPFDIDVGVPVFKIPNLDIITDIASIIPLQLYSLHRCIDYGYNPDKPRNLAKSVTVE